MFNRQRTNSDRIFEMEYNTDPVDGMVDDLKGSTDVLAKVLFAGFNIVFLVILGVILIANFAM